MTISAERRTAVITRSGGPDVLAIPNRPAPTLEADEVVGNEPDAALSSVGARVCGLVGGGAHAEHLVTHEREVAAMPDAIDRAIAGPAPEACITARDALVTQAHMRPGDTVLIHAVGSVLPWFHS